MRSLIKNLQTKDTWAKKIRIEIKKSFRRQRKAWALDQESLVKHSKLLYVPRNAIVREKLIRKNYDNPLAKHFGIKKILDLLQRKYF